MKENVYISGYSYADYELNSSHAHLVPVLMKPLLFLGSSNKNVFDLSCGNGSVAATISKNGWDVKSVNISIEGITIASDNHPHLRFEVG